MKNEIKKIQEELNKSFLRLSRTAVRQLFDRLREESLRRGVVLYDEEGEPRVVDICVRPWVITKRQKRFFHGLCLNMKKALQAAAEIYYNEPQARRILTLTPREEEWFFEIYGAATRRAQSCQTVFDRVDANAVFSAVDWKDSFMFIETNAIGVGGVHYIPAATYLFEDVIFPVIKDSISNIKLERQDDIRELLLETVMNHAKKIGRPRPNVVFMEDQRSLDGSDEHAFAAIYLRTKGMTAFATDPRELYLKDGRIYFRDTPVDIIYRDCSIGELQEMEDRGEKVDILKEAFKKNQVVSSIAGEFDHKSILEIFTDDDYSGYFTPVQRRLFRKYVAWTRLIWDRKTECPAGKRIDLLRYIETRKNSLVIKPNRAYGGKDVIIGRFVKAVEWEKALEGAIRDENSCVVQEYAEVKAERLPVLSENGTVTMEKNYEISGFASSDSGLALMARCSAEPVVNISRKGGIIPVVVVE